MCLSLCGPMCAYNSGTGETIIFTFQGASGIVLGAKMGVMERGQKIGVFSLSRDRPAKRNCRQIGHLALNTQVQT